MITRRSLLKGLLGVAAVTTTGLKWPGRRKKVPTRPPGFADAPVRAEGERIVSYTVVEEAVEPTEHGGLTPEYMARLQRINRRSLLRPEALDGGDA